MEQNIVKPKSKRRSRQEIILLLDEFAKAGIGVQEFCTRHNVGKSTFHKWQSRYKNKEDQPGAPAAFADIHILAPAEHTAGLFAEVNGIKIYRPVTAVYLKELLV